VSHLNSIALALSFQAIRPNVSIGTNIALYTLAIAVPFVLFIISSPVDNIEPAYDGGKMTILVTGATGAVGRHIVRHLLRVGIRVRALTRNPAKANFPEGVNVFQGDLERPESLSRALEDIDRLYLFPVPSTVTKVVQLAKTAGVQRIGAFSSASAPWEAKYHPRGLYYLLVERAVEASGVEWTHIRPVGFMMSALGWVESIRNEGVVRAPYGAASYPHVHEADVAEVATAALLEDGHIGKKYIVSGPESITQIEQAKAIGAAIGRELRFEELTPEEARTRWNSFMPESEIDTELMILEESVNKPQRVWKTFEQVTGRPGRSFAQWAVEHADDFR
jgi:uncharacterized protein YbjT (DUF2867 family)